MPSLNSLIASLSRDYPTITFESGKEFLWSPATTTVVYHTDSQDTAQLLHEVSHAILNHADYQSDIQLITMERDAWQTARSIADSYDVQISDSLVQDHLDTYRDWMHARSTCPSCKSVGVQKAPALYTCPACRGSWKVNEARLCGLRRHLIK